MNRVTRKTKALVPNLTLLPVEFEQPLAIATRLLVPQVDSLLNDGESPDPKSVTITPSELGSPLLGDGSRHTVSSSF